MLLEEDKNHLIPRVKKTPDINAKNTKNRANFFISIYQSKNGTLTETLTII